RMVEKITCEFDLFYYPMDTHTCYIIIGFGPENREQTSLQNLLAKVNYTGQMDLPIYSIREIKIDYSNMSSNLKIAMRLYRGAMSLVVVTTVVPTMMLVAIAYTTLFLKAAGMQVRLLVSLFTLAVLYILYHNMDDSLPRTSRLKMMDIWFLLCCSVIFFIVLFHISLDAVVDADKVVFFKDPEPRFRITEEK
ncbi:unnamed protein product, partial [Meganyctiphanes norvegica]